MKLQIQRRFLEALCYHGHAAPLESRRLGGKSKAGREHGGWRKEAVHDFFAWFRAEMNDLSEEGLAIIRL